MISEVQAAKAAATVAMASFVWIPALPEHMTLIAISGFAGGVSRWIAAKEKFWPQGLSSIILGMIAALFLWPVGRPLLEPFLGQIDMDPLTAVMFGAYVTGLMGVVIITFIADFRLASKRKDSDDA